MKYSHLNASSGELAKITKHGYQIFFLLYSHTGKGLESRDKKLSCEISVDWVISGLGCASVPYICLMQDAKDSVLSGQVPSVVVSRGSVMAGSRFFSGNLSAWPAPCCAHNILCACECRPVCTIVHYRCGNKVGCFALQCFSFHLAQLL